MQQAIAPSTAKTTVPVSITVPTDIGQSNIGLYMRTFVFCLNIPCTSELIGDSACRLRREMHLSHQPAALQARSASVFRDIFCLFFEHQHYALINTSNCPYQAQRVQLK